MISDEELKHLAAKYMEGGPGEVLAEMATELLAHREHDKTPCRWDQDIEGNWQTECDNEFYLEFSTPSDRGFTFCPCCGHKIEEMKND